MRARGWRRSAAAGAMLALVFVGGCGESDETSVTPDVAPGSPQDACRLLSQSDAGSILGASDVQQGVAAVQDECSYSTADGSASLVFEVETKKSFDLTLAEAQRTGASLREVPNLGDQAFYYTPGGAGASPAASPTPSLSRPPSSLSTGAARSSPSPSALPTASGKVITYLVVRKATAYYRVLVRKGEAYDLNAESKAATLLVRRG